MAPLIITESEILAELEKLGTAPDDARTMLELSDATGYSRSKVQQDLGKLHRAGRLVVHRVVRRKLDGKSQIVPAYTVTAGRKGKR